jgi:hypothetical protein
LTFLNLLNNKALTLLWCWYNQFTALDVSKNAALKLLNCGFNQIITLDVSNLTDLQYLNCGGNLLTGLDISHNTKLGTGPSANEALDINDMPGLVKVCVWTLPFPVWPVYVYSAGSPNVTYSTDCGK